LPAGQGVQPVYGVRLLHREALAANVRGQSRVGVTEHLL
jgi:hypothetical protein